VFLSVRAILVTVQEQSSPSLGEPKSVGEELISFEESRSKVNQYIGQSSKIKHCEIGHFSDCLPLKPHSWAAVELFLGDSVTYSGK